MDKRPDFGNDLSALSDNVAAEVGDVLEALRQRKATSQSAKPTSTEATVKPVDSNIQVTDSGEQTGDGKPRRSRIVTRSRLKPIVERDEPLENVTTRLRRCTNELLTEAALRQRLKKEAPATRQDIVESALADWFRKHGYGS